MEPAIMCICKYIHELSTNITSYTNYMYVNYQFTNVRIKQTRWQYSPSSYVNVQTDRPVCRGGEA